MNGEVSLVPIDRDGTPRGYTRSVPEVANEALRATAQLYRRAGFEGPWICYLALVSGTPVGTCGYKAKPQDGRVEIACFTFPEHENRGYASTMAAKLVAIAQGTESFVVVAQTLPDRNASHRVLEKSGFRHVAIFDHTEDGTVWEWQLVERNRT